MDYLLYSASHRSSEYSAWISLVSDQCRWAGARIQKAVRMALCRDRRMETHIFCLGTVKCTEKITGCQVVFTEDQIWLHSQCTPSVFSPFNTTSGWQHRDNRVRQRNWRQEQKDSGWFKRSHTLLHQDMCWWSFLLCAQRLKHIHTIVCIILDRTSHLWRQPDLVYKMCHVTY